MKNVETNKTDTQSYSYYSRLLREPFDSLEELTEAEEAHLAKLKAKEANAAAKKADAEKVQEAFVALNAARKTYKEQLKILVTDFTDALDKLKAEYDANKKYCHDELAAAENLYAEVLREFTDKYKEGYHLTLRDGDFETTISGTQSTIDNKLSKLSDYFNWWLY